MPDRSGPPPLIYADTAVWICSLQGEPGHPTPDSLFRAAARGDVRLIASWLLRVELSKPPAAAVDQSVRDAIDRILDNEQIVWVELDRFASIEALEIARDYGLSGADAVHLATAVRNDADFFMSLDRKFPYGQVVKRTVVTKPTVVWRETLFDGLDEAGGSSS